MERTKFLQLCVKIQEEVVRFHCSLLTKKCDQLLQKFSGRISSGDDCWQELIGDSRLAQDEKRYKAEFLGYSLMTRPHIPASTNSSTYEYGYGQIKKRGVRFGYKFKAWDAMMEKLDFLSLFSTSPSFFDAVTSSKQKELISQVTEAIFFKLDILSKNNLVGFYRGVCADDFASDTPVDVLLVAGGASPARGKTAGQICESRKTCFVLTTGRVGRYIGENLTMSEGELSALAAIDAAEIHVLQVIAESVSETTQGNVRATVPYLEIIAKHFGRPLNIVTVTLPFHSRRFYMEAANEFSKRPDLVASVKSTTAPGLYQESNYWVNGPESNKKGRKGVGFVVAEHLKCMYDLAVKK